MTGKRVLRLGDPNQPWTYLQPLIDILVRGGNRAVFTTPDHGCFVPTPGGWDCYLYDRIDWDLIQREFELPSTIGYSAEGDFIGDDSSYTTIFGSYNRRGPGLDVWKVLPPEVE